MIELREAVSKSLETLKGLGLTPSSVDVELEEAELEKDGNENFWVVTFSYPVPEPIHEAGEIGPNLAAILRKRRAYKEIRLQASDGVVRGLKTIHA